jgi:hypothetical protein
MISHLMNSVIGYVCLGVIEIKRHIETTLS